MEELGEVKIDNHQEGGGGSLVGKGWGKSTHLPEDKREEITVGRRAATDDSASFIERVSHVMGTGS